MPPRAAPSGSASRSYAKLSVEHMTATLAGRGEGEDINLVAQTLHNTGYLERLVDAELFQGVAKGIALAAVDN